MICIAWVEFPQYGARLVGALVQSTSESVVVVATKPRIPIQGMERLAGCKIYWEDKESKRSLKEIIGRTPDVLVVSGWSLPIYKKYANEVHGLGGINIAMVDNDYHPSFQEFLKKVRFNIFLRRRFDAFLVPGAAGRQLLEYYGVNSVDIYTGLYAADSSLFLKGIKLSRRPKKIIYVGQFCERKNVLRLCQAFQRANLCHGNEWQLELCGKGPLRDELPNDRNIIINEFLQPEELPLKYQTSRGFILPSVSEHWGVVVHEGALS